MKRILTFTDFLALNRGERLVQIYDGKEKSYTLASVDPNDEDNLEQGGDVHLTDATGGKRTLVLRGRVIGNWLAGPREQVDINKVKTEYYLSMINQLRKQDGKPEIDFSEFTMDTLAGMEVIVTNEKRTSSAEVVAMFSSEDLYNKCYEVLEKDALSKDSVIVERMIVDFGGK